jgi:hypothetical protein
MLLTSVHWPPPEQFDISLIGWRVIPPTHHSSSEVCLDQCSCSVRFRMLFNPMAMDAILCIGPSWRLRANFRQGYGLSPATMRSLSCCRPGTAERSSTLPSRRETDRRDNGQVTGTWHRLVTSSRRIRGSREAARGMSHRVAKASRNMTRATARKGAQRRMVSSRSIRRRFLASPGVGTWFDNSKGGDYAPMSSTSPSPYRHTRGCLLSHSSL